MRSSFLKKRKGQPHHPGGMTAGAMINGRYLETAAVTRAKTWRSNMFKYLSGQHILRLTFKQRHLLRSLQLEFKKGAINVAG